MGKKGTPLHFWGDKTRLRGVVVVVVFKQAREALGAGLILGPVRVHRPEVLRRGGADDLGGGGGIILHYICYKNM